MNIIDLAAILLLALFVVIGVYRGFLRSMATVCIFVVAFVFAAIFTGPMVRQAYRKTELYEAINYYTEGDQLLASAGTGIAQSPVDSFRRDELVRILAATTLPVPVQQAVVRNAVDQRKSGLGITSLAEYVDATLTENVLGVGSFIILFVSCVVVLQVGLAMYNALRPLPVLKKHDSLLGGLCGVLFGLMTVMAVFCVLPVVQSVLPVQEFGVMMNKSRVGMIIQEVNFMLSTTLRTFIT